MSTIADAGCGTYAGYQRHRRYEGPACEPCREANRTYHRSLRARNPELRQREAAANSARSRALWRLAAEYPQRFRELLAAEQSEGSDRND